MIDRYTLESCSSNTELLKLKIKNIEHALQAAEKLIAESRMNESAISFLRKRIAESRQDLEILYLLKES